MTVEIEYYKGDTLLQGQKISFDEFKKQINTIEKCYNKDEDNFVELLCSMYHWAVIENGQQRAEFIYDRDIEKCRSIHKNH